MAGENINRKLNIYINDKEVVNSLSGITREMGKTRNELKNLNKNADDYEEEVKRLTKHLQDLNDKQTEFKDELKLTSKEMGAARENFSNLLGGLASGDMKAVQDGLIGIRGSILSTTQAAWAFVATPIGAFVAGFVALGAGVKFLWDYNSGLTDLNNKLSSLGVASESISKVRSEIQATAQTFDKEFNEIAEKANSLSKTYKISMSEANDIIAQGLADGGNLNNEFLDSLSEYDEFFAKAGYSAKEFIDVINTGYDLGIYQDKLPDALKEADLSLKEQTKTTRDALINAFGGSFTDEILKKVRTGEMSTKEALEAIAVKSKEVGLSQQQEAQLTADVFKGAGEDAGGAQKILDAVAASSKRNLSDSAKLTDELRLSNERLNEVQSEMFEVSGFADAWTKVKTAGVDAFTVFLEGMSDFKQDIQPIIDLVGVVLYGSWEAVKFLFVNSFEIIGAAFHLFGNGVKTFVQFFTKLFTGDIVGAFKTVGNGIVDMGKIVGNVFLGIKNNVLTTVSNIIDIVSPMLDALGLDVDRIKKKLESWKSTKFEIKGDVKVKTPNNPSGTPERTITKDSGNADANKEAADAAKKREKTREDAKKHSEALKKDLEATNKELLDIQRLAQDTSLAAQKDGYAKEAALLNTEYDRKIEDTKIKVAALQSEIEKLSSDAKDPKNTKADDDVIKAMIASKIAAQKEYTSSLVSIEQTRGNKIGALQEKYLEKSFQKEQEEHAKSLLLLKTKQNFELAEVTSLAQAKGILAKSLSSDELSKITTLEKAKKAIKEQNLKEQYALEIANLDKIVKLYESVINNNDSGLVLLSDEEKEKLLAALDQAKAKIAEIKGAGSADDKATDVVATTGVDILGFDSSVWENTFNNLDTTKQKLEAVKMVASALTTAFSAYFKFLEAGEARTLQKFQNSADKKKRSLADQLEKGIISQEVYNAKVAKIDADIARKKAEIEYKQAKRQKAMAIVNAIVNTAVGIMQAYAQLGPVGGTIAAVLIGAMGALEIATIAKQPLPDKSGFKGGGYTGNGNPNDVSTALGNKDYTYHKGEYVVPQDVLFSNDPVVPNIVGYLEAKRTGKQPMTSQDEPGSSPANGQSISGGSYSDMQVVNALNRNSNILEKIEEEGLQAYLVNDYKTAKKMRDKIKEVTKNETNAKP